MAKLSGNLPTKKGIDRIAGMVLIYFIAKRL
jgi:hypothetical protein